LIKSINSFDANPHSDRIQITSFHNYAWEAWKHSCMEKLFILFKTASIFLLHVSDLNAVSIAANDGKKIKFFYINCLVKTSKTHRMRNSSLILLFCIMYFYYVFLCYVFLYYVFLYYLFLYYVFLYLIWFSQNTNIFPVNNTNKFIFGMKMHCFNSEVGNEV
jgi:hypothetical protein